MNMIPSKSPIHQITGGHGNIVTNNYNHTNCIYSFYLEQLQKKAINFLVVLLHFGYCEEGPALHLDHPYWGNLIGQGKSLSSLDMDENTFLVRKKVESAENLFNCCFSFYVLVMTSSSVFELEMERKQMKISAMSHNQKC